MKVILFLTTILLTTSAFARTLWCTDDFLNPKFNVPITWVNGKVYAHNKVYNAEIGETQANDGTPYINVSLTLNGNYLGYILCKKDQ